MKIKAARNMSHIHIPRKKKEEKGEATAISLCFTIYNVKHINYEFVTRNVFLLAALTVFWSRQMNINHGQLKNTKRERVMLKKLLRPPTWRMSNVGLGLTPLKLRHHNPETYTKYAIF